MTSPATSWTGSGQDGDLRVRGSHQRFRFLGGFQSTTIWEWCRSAGCTPPPLCAVSFGSSSSCFLVFFPGKLFLDRSGVCVRKEEEEDRKVVVIITHYLLQPQLHRLVFAFQSKGF